jgi:hypothetical protein
MTTIDDSRDVTVDELIAALVNASIEDLTPEDAMKRTIESQRVLVTRVLNDSARLRNAMQGLPEMLRDAANLISDTYGRENRLTSMMRRRAKMIAALTAIDEGAAS